MSRFSSKPKQVSVNLHGSTLAWLRKTRVQKKRSLAAKKAAATRKRNRQASHAVTMLPVDQSYLEDLRDGLHKDWRNTKDLKPVIFSCDDVPKSASTQLVRAASRGHGSDFSDYAWDCCPAAYFNAVLYFMSQRVAVNGATYPKVIRDRARMLSMSLKDVNPDLH